MCNGELCDWWRMDTEANHLEIPTCSSTGAVQSLEKLCGFLETLGTTQPAGCYVECMCSKCGQNLCWGVRGGDAKDFFACSRSHMKQQICFSAGETLGSKVDVKATESGEALEVLNLGLSFTFGHRQFCTTSQSMPISNPHLLHA